MKVFEAIRILETMDEDAEFVMADYAPIQQIVYDKSYGDGVVIATDEEDYE